VLAQFLYVAAQTGIFSFFINYLVENVSGMTDSRAKNLLGVGGFGLFMFGRFCGSFVVGLMKPQKALTIYASVCFVLSLLAMAGLGMVGVVALFGTFFFMSIMFPTIFALGIRGLGEHTKLASSLIVMSIVGGAIAPPVMGWIADHYSMKVGFAIPMVCFIFIAIYGLIWKKLENKGRRCRRLRRTDRHPADALKNGEMVGQATLCPPRRSMRERPTRRKLKGT